MKKIVLIILLAITVNVNADDKKGGIQFRKLTFEQALDASKKEGKMVFMHGYASWCHFCAFMGDSVYPDPEVGAVYNEKFICIKLDLEKEGAELNKTLKSHTYPCLVFFDAKGEVVHRASGRHYKSMFLELAKEAQDPRRQLRSWINIYNDGKVSADTAYQVIRKMEVAGMETQEMLMKYLNRLKPEEITQPQNWKIINECFKDVNSPFMQTLIDRKKELEGLYTKKTVDEKFLGVFSFELYMRTRLLDSLGYDALKQRIMNSNLDIKEMIVQYSDMQKYRAASQYDIYMELASSFVNNYAMDNKDMLYEITQFFYEKAKDASQLLTALPWSQRTVQLDDSYKNNVLLCGILVRLGDKSSAHAIINHALELAKQKNINNRTALLMLDKVEEMQ